MILVLAGLHFDLDALRQQVLGNAEIPTMEDLINRLLWLFSSTTIPIIIDNATLVTQTSDHGHGGGQSNRGGCGGV